MAAKTSQKKQWFCITYDTKMSVYALIWNVPIKSLKNIFQNTNGNILMLLGTIVIIPIINV